MGEVALSLGRLDTASHDPLLFKCTAIDHCERTVVDPGFEANGEVHFAHGFGRVRNYVY